MTIPKYNPTTLHSYATRIIAQNVFNVHGKIQNKTETRSTAEWSFRSCISFAMTVAATHFLPDVAPSPFHRRRQDICQKSKELLELVEIEYSKMYRKDVRVVPVLPNLVTSTDETTVFVTSGVIKDNERVHITAKPIAIKNDSVRLAGAVLHIFELHISKNSFPRHSRYN